jgi:hypothetical protein
LCVSSQLGDFGSKKPFGSRVQLYGPGITLDGQIGLAVVRELVGRHGGKTWVEEGREGGARFVVEFPKTAQLDEKATIQDRPPADLNTEEIR